MKYLIIGALLFFGGLNIQAQNSIEQVLRLIETNNKELCANRQWGKAQKLEAQADNNLSDPTLSYAHLWDAKNKGETIGELVISQQFDFPSLYVSRHRLNGLKAVAIDSRTALLRQEKLLQAKELCLDIILLRRQKQLLEEQLAQAEELDRLYAKRLETGDANIIDTNKIRLELLNIKTEAALNETTLRNKMQELQTMNGNLPLVFEENRYPTLPFPDDYSILKSEVIAADRNLAAVTGESLVAHRQVSVSRSGWLPKLELGYRRNMETGLPFNGVVVGFSFPLFENRNRVKIAKVQALHTELQKEQTMIQTEAELAQLYQEAQTLHASMEEYNRTFRSQRDRELLKQALTGGQINIIEYFVEITVLYQSQQNYLQLENRYQKVMARIYKSRL